MPLGGRSGRPPVEVMNVDAEGMDPDHVEYSKNGMLDWMIDCFREGCFPVFRTRYASVRLMRNTVLGVCMGCGGYVRSVAFHDVPGGLIDAIEEPGVGWRAVAKYHGENPDVFIGHAVR